MTLIFARIASSLGQSRRVKLAVLPLVVQVSNPHVAIQPYGSASQRLGRMGLKPQLGGAGGFIHNFLLALSVFPYAFFVELGEEFFGSAHLIIIGSQPSECMVVEPSFKCFSEANK